MMVVFVGGILGGETQGWTFIGLRERMKEGLFMSAHMLSFERWDDWHLRGSVMSVRDRKIWGEMPGIKNGCHVGCPAIGLFMTSVWGGGACVRAREKECAKHGKKWEREKLGNRFRVSEAEDEGRKAMRGERGLVLSRDCGSMPSHNPALTNS